MSSQESLSLFASPDYSLEVVHYGHPALRQKGLPVSSFDGDLKLLSEKMFDYIEDPESRVIGLAAPQIGLSLQFFVISLKEDSRIKNLTCFYDEKLIPFGLIMPLFLANTQIIKRSEDTVTYEESCASLPGNIFCPVERANTITVRFQDINGQWHTLTCEDIFSVCLQHEYDHTMGKLIIDYADALTLKKLEPKLKKLKRQARDAYKKK